MPKRPWIRAYLAAASLVATVYGGAAGAAEHQVTIAGMKFTPAILQLQPGDVVVWKNEDIFRHTATARGGGFDLDLPPKTARRLTVNETGPVDYYCRFHPAMVGKLEIGP